MAKKVFTDESLSTFIDEIKSYTDESSATRATKGHGIYYGTCDTAADTAAKVVTLADSTGFSLTVGAVVVVKFTNNNSVASPTLNVNSTGAKSIYRYGTTAASTSQSSSGWRAGAVQMFVYDGTGWVRDFWENTTYSNVALGQGYVTCSTAAATTAKVGTLSSYTLSTGGIVAVKFTYAVPASATLNINSKGAKAIYYRGVAITDGIIEAGDVATFIYNGSQYHLISIDRWQEDIEVLKASVSGKADKTHTHAIADVSGLQTALDGKAASSHGTHVTYSTTAPVMDGTASVGSASTVARSDHKHPTDTSRASKTEFDTHVADTTVHITSTERTNWNAAKTHADSAHAPSNAEKNQNAFSNIAVSGQTTVAADSVTDTVTLVGSNVSITTDATNDKVTFTVADGTTSAKGVVQLTNSTSSTSTTTAATPSSVKTAYDLANTAKTNAATAQTRADSAYSLAESKVDSLSDLGITVTAAELNYVDGITSNIQTQLNAKVPTSRTINGKALTDNITLSASDVGASSTSHEHSASKITSGILAVERGGTGNLWGYIQVGAEEGTSIGALATAEGRNVTASGDYCHAEGNYTEASGSSAHAEGQSSTASGIASHAEGNNATASGNYSHAEGDSTNASAKGAHAEGTYTLASSDYQHVQGKFNIEDKAGTYAHIVGNGTGTSNSARSNAHTLDWDGNAWFAGNVYVGGTSQDDAAQAASVASYTATIGTTWTGSAAPYTQDITVTGITANDKPVVDLTFSGTYATDQARLADWNKIYRIVTAANKITIYATNKTAIALPIQLQVVR